MKKNIKFVGAAAAALLAVAPVVASTTVASAATTVPVEVSGNGSTTTATATTKAVLSVSVSNVNAIKDGAAASSLKVNLNSNVGTPKVTGGKALVYPKSEVQINDGVATVSANAHAVSTLKKGTEYAVVVKDVTLSGFTADQKGVTVNGKDVKVDTYGNITTPTTVGAYFTTPDTSLTGEPYVYTKIQQGGIKADTVVSNGTVSVAADGNNKVSVSSVVDAITKNFAAQAAGTATASFTNVEGDVNSALNAASIPVSNGSFTAPASGLFTVNVSVLANNGKTMTFPVLVITNGTNLTDSQKALYPVITYNGKDLSQPSATVDASGASFANVALNGSVDTAAIKNAFGAKVVTNDGKQQSLSVSVDTSKVNTAVAGKYPVTVSATNANNNTSKAAFTVTVGVAGATYKTTAQAGDVYSLNGNTATKTSETVNSGASLATFGTVTIDGTSYTIINSKNSGKAVLTSLFTSQKTTEKTIMHIAQYYDKDGKKTTLNGKNTVGAYNKVTVYENTVTINGKKYYQVAGSTVYIKATNVDPTSRTLGHNAYIYNNKGKRVQKTTTLKKGSNVNTYGGAFSIKQNGVKKAMYRINKNQYVKVANFK
ncbi:hypothetical protein J2Z60_000583 [Lactobacillus colini]|uniref:S-layer protein n=1 Tax=Lactobacillus colini TaxID=1819254 RepID=A0ABS4MCM3_9LACO|nr:SLAP domain-containing protein [Lactobacillus colini]MBP2057419.1 hypothetical protein [Lactobacillus colini]